MTAFIFLAATTWAWPILRGMVRRALSPHVIDVCYEVDTSSGGNAKGECGFSIMMCYRKISHPQDVHADYHVLTARDRQLRNQIHRKTNFIGEADID